MPIFSLSLPRVSTLKSRIVGLVHRRRAPKTQDVPPPTTSRIQPESIRESLAKMPETKKEPQFDIGVTSKDEIDNEATILQTLGFSMGKFSRVAYSKMGNSISPPPLPNQSANDGSGFYQLDEEGVSVDQSQPLVQGETSFYQTDNEEEPQLAKEDPVVPDSFYTVEDNAPEDPIYHTEDSPGADHQGPSSFYQVEEPQPEPSLTPSEPIYNNEVFYTTQELPMVPQEQPKDEVDFYNNETDGPVQTSSMMSQLTSHLDKSSSPTPTHAKLDTKRLVAQVEQASTVLSSQQWEKAETMLAQILQRDHRSLPFKISTQDPLNPLGRPFLATQDGLFALERKLHLGQGREGKVKKGHAQDGREIAVKVVLQQDKKDYYISRYHGVNLRQLAPTYALGNDDKLALAIGLAQSMAELHDHNIIHNDLNPGNILVNNQGKVQLVDFGLSSVLSHSDEQVPTGKVFNKYTAAPEVLEHGVLSKKTDVYALDKTIFNDIGLELPSSIRQQLTHRDPNQRPDIHQVVKLLTDYQLSLSQQSSAPTQDSVLDVHQVSSRGFNPMQKLRQGQLNTSRAEQGSFSSEFRTVIDPEHVQFGEPTSTPKDEPTSSKPKRPK